MLRNALVNLACSALVPLLYVHAEHLFADAHDVERQRALYKAHGVVIVRNAFLASEIQVMRTAVMAYIERKGPLTATRALSGRGGSDRGGWYIGNFPAVPRLKKLILDRMLKNDALRGAVHAVHASDKQVRLLSRSEVYVDSLADFHFDGNPGTRAFLNQRPNNRSALNLFVAKKSSKEASL